MTQLLLVLKPQFMQYAGLLVGNGLFRGMESNLSTQHILKHSHFSRSQTL